MSFLGRIKKRRATDPTTGERTPLLAPGTREWWLSVELREDKKRSAEKYSERLRLDRAEDLQPPLSLGYGDEYGEQYGERL